MFERLSNSNVEANLVIIEKKNMLKKEETIFTIPL